MWDDNRFAETEAVSILTRLISKFKISVNYDVFDKIEGETEMETRERLLKCTQGITITPVKVPLVFQRR